MVTVYSYTAGQLAGVEYFGSVPGWENYRNLRTTWQDMVADPANHTAQEIFDAEAAMLAAKAAAIHATTPAVTTTYDRLGRPVSQSNGFSTTDYSYNLSTLAMDAETVTIDADGSGPLPAMIRYLERSNDTLGRPGGTAVLEGGGGTTEHFNNCGYDSSGRLSSVTSPAGTFTYTYIPNSSLIATVVSPVHTVTNSWEPNRDVLDVKDNRIPSTNTVVSGFNYGVNNIGQRTGVTTTGSAFPSQPADWNWGYDALGQVTSADSPTSTFDRAYQYDQIGNRKKSADGALVTTGPSATVYDANNLNQYSEISVPSAVPTHDLDGNMTTGLLNGSTTGQFEYDGANQLIRTQSTSTSDPTRYAYDASGRRVAKITYPNAGGVATAATLFIYDGWNLIAEYKLDASAWTLDRTYTWGIDLSGSTQGAGGVGGLLAVTKFPLPAGGGQGEGVAYYATYDGNGNIEAYLDSNGAPAAIYQYDAFGNVLSGGGKGAAIEQTKFSHRFSTKCQDAETGLLYYGYRYFHAVLGRWVNRDPIGESGGVNLYGFVGNASQSHIDILGQSPTGGSRLISGREAAALMSPDVKDLLNAFRKGGEVRKNLLAQGLPERLIDILDKSVNPTSKALLWLGMEKFNPGGAEGDGNNKFVYICRCGWIDLGHFSTSAGISALIDDFTSPLGTAIGRPLELRSAAILASFAGGVQIEFEQAKAKRSPAYSPGPINPDYWGASAWTLEDLPSDFMGAAMGPWLPETKSPLGAFVKIRNSMTAFFKFCRDVDPANRLPDGNTARHYLEQDAKNYGNAALLRGFSPNPVYGINPYNFTPLPMRTTSHCKVCDENNEPIHQ